MKSFLSSFGNPLGLRFGLNSLILNLNNEVVIVGNLNHMDVIWQGTPESVIEHAKDCIAKADGCRFYLATGCETPRDTPIENLQAMKTAVEKYGRYD